jgi:riboflavin kinase / FMN adenylyltransferase
MIEKLGAPCRCEPHVPDMAVLDLHECTVMILYTGSGEERVSVQRWRGLEDIPRDWGRSVVTIGSYDGVHRGHQLIIGRAVQRARERGVPSVVVTFDPHPSEVVRPGSHPPLLAPHHRRAELMAELGVDAQLVLPFTAEFSKLSPADFIVKVLVEKLHALVVIEGPNFRFGHRAAGDVGVLAGLGAAFDYEVEVVDLSLSGEAAGGEPFSSTLTRRLVAEGDMTGAAEILGRPHRVEGVVVRGAQRGHELGFPTANVETLPHTAIPADGVYAGWLIVAGERMPAAISVGTNPQFDGTERTVEAYAIDRVGLDLYGLHVAVDFLAYVRGMEKFESVDALLVAIADDVKRCTALIEAYEQRQGLF